MYSILSCLTLLTVGVVGAPVATDPIVDLGYARYRGTWNDSTGVTTYFGLHYAVNPTGPLRYQAPVPIEKATSTNQFAVLDATTPGLQCVQYLPAWYESLEVWLSAGMEVGTPRAAGEDCLLVDVLVPNSPVSANLPVVMQIHGGGYTVGSSTTFDGNPIVSFSNGQIILVQVQYRLGPDGFLSSSEVRANGTGNAGLLDMRAAIEWAQRHIAAFGGDPSKITIWGGSAGGGAVANQMILYGGVENPPFRAAIPEYPWMQTYHADDILEAQYQELLQASNCDNLSCLRSLDPATLANASQTAFMTGYTSGHYGFGDFYFGPAVDGIVIRDLPSNEFQAGHFTKVPMLVDHDGFEGVIFSNTTLSAESQVQPDLQLVWPAATPSFFTELFDLYPLSSFQGSYLTQPILQAYSSVIPSIASNAPFYQRASIYGDYIIDCPTRYMASALSNATLPVYKLRFQAGTELHGATSAFVFADSNTSPNATLADWMKGWWLGFIAEMNPNAALGVASDRPGWPIYQAEREGVAGPLILDVNATNVGVNFDIDDSDRCAFFEANREIIRN